MSDAPLEFIARWTSDLRALEANLADPAVDVTRSKRRVEELGEELTSRAVELPTYELARSQKELKRVLDDVNNVKLRAAPKPKFSFKRSTLAVAARPPTSEQSRGACSLAQTTTSTSKPSASIPSTTMTLKSRSNEYLTPAALPTTSSSTRPEALLLDSLESCFVDFLPSDTDVKSDDSSPNSIGFPAVYLSNLKGCTVLLPVVKGSIMVLDCQDCVLVLGAHQFRMHDSNDCRVYLEAGSTPVIERCRRLIFDRYPELFRSDSSSSPVETKEAKFVQDFDHPFATAQTPSPNWRYSTDEDRPPWVQQDSERWSTMEGRRSLFDEIAKNRRA
ncbi:hypothetical protein JCM10212_000737 [Sporobolomyces blumeae]